MFERIDVQVTSSTNRVVGSYGYDCMTRIRRDDVMASSLKNLEDSKTHFSSSRGWRSTR
jgi:hypothetical protein